MTAELVLAGEEATHALGHALGIVLRPGDLLALDGDLGAGKTTLVRGVAAGMGLDGRDVRSPTYVLHHVYRAGGITLHHVDAYRLGRGADLRGEIDLEALLADGVVAVEWAEYADLHGLGAVGLRLDAPEPASRVARLAPGAPARLVRAFLPELA